MIPLTRQAEGADSSQVAEQGDEVTVSYVCQTTQGDTVMSSEETGEPLSFEVGTRDFMGNPFFQGIDEAVRGLSVGQVRPRAPSESVPSRILCVVCFVCRHGG